MASEIAGDEVTTRSLCWYCGETAVLECECGRLTCGDHTFGGRCLICALGFGFYEGGNVAEPISGLLLLSLRAASGDPYIVIPPALQGVRPLPLEGVEMTVGTLVKMLGVGDAKVRRRAAAALAGTTIAWPTMNPNPLAPNVYSISLLAADQVRHWLLHILKDSRPAHMESTALPIMEKLQIADFRDPYPILQENFTTLRCGTLGARVKEVFDAIADLYPTHSHPVNERCELMVYEHYTNPARGADQMLTRLYGPLLKYSPTLKRLLKKGTWLSNQSRYEEWYRGEPEPV